MFVGHNAIGKTNILESIYLLATGDSFRADKIEEMVNWETEVRHERKNRNQKLKSEIRNKNDKAQISNINKMQMKNYKC